MTHENSSEPQGKTEKGVLRLDQNQLISEKGFSFSGYERDPLYLNLGTKRFLDISGVSGIDSISDGRAGVFADFDNDGDLDVFLTTIQGQAHMLFRNNVGHDRNFIRVSLEGRETGRDAYGAVVRLKTSAGILTKIKAGGSGFISQHDPRLLFGLAKDQRAEWLEVTWANGRKQRFENIPSNTSILIKEGAARYETVSEKRSNLPDPVSKEDLLLKTLSIRKGSPLPDLMVENLDGKRSNFKAHFEKGTKTLINVWATWCAPCAKEIPELERLQHQLRKAKVRLIGLSVDSDGTDIVKKYLTVRGITYPNFVGGTGAMEKIYANDEATVPLSILLDENGNVMEVFGGWSKQTQEKIERLAGF